MDDEVQYRCAGYIQAEIYRYAEFLDDNADEEEDNQKSDAEELSEDENEGNSTTKKKEVKPRKTPRKKGQILVVS